ncbi:MAG: hypothetical protein IH923_10040 [Nitrospinae bacterium]|nr:hypothetical protein [Nitrospinota bacterium]
MIILVLGLLGLCLVWSRYKAASFIVYLSSAYWVYTLYQTDLLQIIGPNAFYWSGAVALGLGGILLTIMNVMPARY